MRHGTIHRHRQKTAIAKPVIIIGLRQRRNTPPSPKTAEERLYMLARGWLAYPVTPVAHATTAEERLYMSSLRDESPVCKYYIP